MRKTFATALILLCSLAANALPLVWRADWPGSKPVETLVHRGTDIELQPTWYINGAPADTTNWTYQVFVQTNNQATGEWFGPIAGTTFSHTNDVGAAMYQVMLRAQTPGGAVNYTAFARLRMLDSPGFAPGELPLPAKTIDFSKVVALNAPWLLPEATNDIGTIKVELGSLSNSVSTLSAAVATNSADIATINSKIPSAASASNQLADKEWIDDEIDTYAAYYITYTAAGAAFPTRAALLSATVVYSGGAARTPTRNDYAVVLADETHGGAEWRYIYTVAAGATSGQWDAQYPIETNDYDGLSNKPQINGISLSGNKTGAQLGVLDLAGGTMTGEFRVGADFSGNFQVVPEVPEGSYTLPTMRFSDAAGVVGITWRIVDGSVVMDVSDLLGSTYRIAMPSANGTLALTSDISAAVQQIAPAWVSGTTYTWNALVTYNGVVYCNTGGGTFVSDIPPSSDTNWSAKKVSELFLPLAGGTVKGELTIGSNTNNAAEFIADASGAVSLTLRDSVGNFLQVTGGKLFYRQYNWQEGVELYFPSAEGTLALTSDISAAISPTSPAFSNAVLSVGLGIDTNTVAVINELVDSAHDLPVSGATSVGALLLALAAAIAALKKNLRYSYNTASVTYSTTTDTNDTATVTNVADRAINTATLGSSVTATTVTLPAATPGRARDFFIDLTIEASSAPTLVFNDPATGMTANVVFGADSLADIDTGDNLVLFTEVGQTVTGGAVTGAEWMVSVKHEDA